MSAVMQVRRTLINAGFFLLLCLSPFAFSPPPCVAQEGGRVIEGGVISRSVTFEGEVVVSADLYVPPGVTVRFAEGAVVRFKKSESTKVEPENFLSGTEITIRGNVVSEGARFLFEGDGGLVVDGGSLTLANSVVSGGTYGVLLLSGKLRAEGSEIRNCETGLLVAGTPGKDTDLSGKPLLVTGCKTGAIVPEGYDTGGMIDVRAPTEYGVLTFASHFDEEGGFVPDPVDDLKKGFSPGEVIEDLFIEKDRELQGDVLVKGVVRVAPGAHLSIKAGSRIFFEFSDSNGDGIGESGLFLQGTLVVSGTEAEPVVFASMRGSKKGLWDSINFMASDLQTNRIENAVILESFRGLHSHFSDVHIKNVRIYRTFRGLQFQESKVVVEGLGIFDSVSALRCRDSDVAISGMYTAGNVAGGNFLRVRGTVRDVFFSDNVLYGIRFRESDIEMEKARVTGGLYSLSLQEGVLRFRGVSQADSLFAGFQAQRSEVKIDDSKFQQNKIYGFSLRGGRYVLKNVTISGSGVEKINVEENPEITIK